MKKILDLDVYDGMIIIDPDNKGYPFVSCEEMSLLSVMNYYKKNYLPLMVKMNFIYKFNGEEEEHTFQSINPNLDDKFDLLENIGIERKIHVVEGSKELDLFRDCMINNHPVQFMIDLFYQEGREYYYNFQHGGHDVIGYGFDDEKEILHIIDNVRGYDKYEIRYDQVNRLRGAVQGTEIWEYINSKDINTFSDEYTKRMLDMYCRGIREQHDLRMNAINEISSLIERFSFCAANPNFSQNVNGEVYNKTSELCRMTYLRKFGLYKDDVSDQIEKLLREIVKKWKRIHSLICYKELSLYSAEDYTDEITCLEGIMGLEKELVDVLANGLADY